MSRLKNRVSRLENMSEKGNVAGVVIYFENEKRDNEDIISADWYLDRDGGGEPLTDAALEKALEGKTYICHLPVKEKRPECIEVGKFKNTTS